MPYAIFEVHDYKGGELASYTNMTRKGVVEHLANNFEELDVENEENPTLEEIKEAVKERFEEEDFFTTYAGGEGFVGEIYEITDNMMDEVDFKDFLDEISELIHKTWTS